MNAPAPAQTASTVSCAPPCVSRVCDTLADHYFSCMWGFQETTAMEE